jgi:S-(hydroxymethyl)mycothiol dehydrogenase
MAHEVRGVIARGKGEPVTIETVVVPDPGPGEALVTVQACGVCHTDLHYREGGINDDFPFLLGHEAAGLVEAVGDGVTGVSPGDFVVLSGRCAASAGPAARAGPTSASPPTTPPRR